MNCCVCGQPTSAAFFMGDKEDGRVVCETCKKRYETLLNGKDEQRILALCKFFWEKADSCKDPDVREYLKNMLRKRGYSPSETTMQRYPSAATTQRDISQPVEKSGWIIFLKLLVKIEIIGGCIGSIVLGVGLGEAFDAPALGAGITLIGILMTFVLTAAVMVFLDMASDVRTIRGFLRK